MFSPTISEMEKSATTRLRSQSLKRGEFSEGGAEPSLQAFSHLRNEAFQQPSEVLIQDFATSGEDEVKESSSTPAKGFGEKTISFWGSCALNFNNIAGPTMVVLPLLFQQAGWLLPTVSLLLMWALSSFAAAMLCEAMQRIPGNRSFGRRYEYCTLVRYYFGQKWYAVAMVAYNVGLTASNIAAMIVTSQVLDSLVSRILGSTYGLDYLAWPPAFKAQGGAEQPCKWGETENGTCSTSVLSLGYALAAIVCIPMGLLSLEDNMWMQWISVGGQLSFSLYFIGFYTQSILPHSATFCPGNGPQRTPIIGGNISQVVGVAVFSYSYVSTIPSWVNEKRPGVGVNRAIWLPSLLAVTLNITLALFGAWSFNLLHADGRPLDGTENILNVLVARAAKETSCHSEQVPLTLELSACLWGISGYLPGIPVLAIMVKYNLVNSGLLNPSGAFLCGVLAPWIVTAFFYQAEVLLQFCNWMAILFQGFINFVIPALLYRAALLSSKENSLEKEGEEKSLNGEENELSYVSTAGGQQKSFRSGQQSREYVRSIEDDALQESSSPMTPYGDASQEARQMCHIERPVSKSPLHGIEVHGHRFHEENNVLFKKVLSERKVDNSDASIELVQLLEEDGKGEKPAARPFPFSRTEGPMVCEEGEEAEETVNAVPEWLPISPLQFSTWMGGGLGVLVCLLIADSFVRLGQSAFVSNKG